MQERLNQTIVVENRSGANGGIAVNAMLSAPADGATFVVTDGAILSINPQPLDAAAAWIAEQKAFWTPRLDTLEALLREDAKKDQKNE